MDKGQYSIEDADRLLEELRELRIRALKLIEHDLNRSQPPKDEEGEAPPPTPK